MNRPALFARTPATWLIYLLVGYFMYMQASLGPVVPFLRAELGLGYGVAGLHFGAFAVGVLLTGMLADRPVRLLGRRKVLWGGAFGMAIGAACLAAGGGAPATLAGTLVMGFCGSLLLISGQAALSDLHGDLRAVALTEANVAAGAAAILAPLAVGFFSRTEVPGWQGALLVAIAALVAAAFWFARTQVPEAIGRATSPKRAARGAALPAAFWGWCVVLFFCISVEWSVAYWGASFLAGRTNLEAAGAATLMGVYFVALLAGRYFGSRLARHIRPGKLLTGAVILSMAGFLPFWLAPLVFPPGAATTWMSAFGLFVTGLGIGNLYPLNAALAIGAASEMVDRATARMALTVGFAILVVPPGLGLAAGRFGMGPAYGLVAALLVLAAILTLAVDRGVARSSPPITPRTLRTGRHTASKKV